MIATQTQLKYKTVKIKDLLKMQDLKIPVYQRPYKWQEKNVVQLVNDINLFKKKSAYRLGTMVIHHDSSELNIVDGQQRTISCVLLFKAILQTIKISDPSLRNDLADIEKHLVSFQFDNPVSIKNIRDNFNSIKRITAKLSEDFVRFFIDQCELIYFEIDHISEAFQFFDAQNARGKDLEPHDLLKAYHLREYSFKDEAHKLKDVAAWEEYQSDDLARLFSEYLFRIKSWTRGQSAHFFSKNEIYLFKGVNVDSIESYSYADSLRILHNFVDEYNSSYHRRIDLQKRAYPFQLDAPIINGRRFFEMISYYKLIFDETVIGIQQNSHLSEISKNIFKVIKEYPGWNRTGDTYVRTLFECALVFYVDKFGYYEINQAIEKIFAWSYKLRLQYYAIQFVSVDNYVLSENIFSDIKNSFSPQEALKRKVDYQFNMQREITELQQILSSLYYI